MVAIATVQHLEDIDLRWREPLRELRAGSRLRFEAEPRR
jgi:hypothetical protein